MIHRLQEIQSIYISQNRLVEGKDYVRAEWLKGTGGCYIDTLINPAWNDQLSVTTNVRGRPTVNNPVLLKAQGTNTRIGILLGGAWRKDNVPQILAYQKVTGTDEYYCWHNFPASAEIYVSIKVTNNTTPTVSCKIDGTSKNSSRTGTNIITDLPDTTYKIGDAAANGLDVLNLKNIKINSHNFVPCRLLHSIPATLDANGIARTAGECGMVDSISGKFYGNVASSGSFSVENLDESGTIEDTRLHQIYKNKLVEGKDYTLGEMLKGTGGCYIDTLINPAWNDQLSATTEVEGQPTVNNPFILWAYDSNVEIALLLGGDWYRQNIPQVMCNHRDYGTNQNIIFMDFPSTAEICIAAKITYNATPTVNCKINGTSISAAVTSSSIITNLPNTTYKIGRENSNGLDVLNLKNVKINSHNFIPCQLLRSIPRNLDAQCKSRQAGECGMIDLISGRFYGNVANSGAFSLAWDEWLKDCSIQIAIPSTCYAFNYTTRVDTTKLTSELVDFDFIKLSNTQIVYGDEDDGHVYTVDWGTNKWATLNISYNRGAVATILNGTTVGTSYNTILDPNPHIQLYDIMQIKQIDWSIFADNITTTTTLTRYVDENTGQQGLISDQDGTIIYAD